MGASAISGREGPRVRDAFCFRVFGVLGAFFVLDIFEGVEGATSGTSMISCPSGVGKRD
jgi:hypothetical protein